MTSSCHTMHGVAAGVHAWRPHITQGMASLQEYMHGILISRKARRRCRNTCMTSSYHAKHGVAADIYTCMASSYRTKHGVAAGIYAWRPHVTQRMSSLQEYMHDVLIPHKAWRRCRNKCMTSSYNAMHVVAAATHAWRPHITQSMASLQEHMHGVLV